MHPFVDHTIMAVRQRNDGHKLAPKPITRNDTALAIVLATLPFVGLAAGVAGAAFWLR